jgi:plastocyanin
VSFALVALCAAAGSRAATVEVRLAQTDGLPLADAVLVAYPAAAGRPTPASKVAVMDQRDHRFVPHVLAVETGTRVRFPNSDNVSHHVYSFSPAKRFEIFLAKGAPAREVEFDRPGVVALGCNIHDWMLAYIDVVDSPFFAVTGADGAAALADLPAGTYRLEAWHPRLVDPPAMLHREVTLQAASREQWSLRLEKALLPARDQRPRFVDY